jgi:hypothetical protein
VRASGLETVRRVGVAWALASADRELSGLPVRWSSFHLRSSVHLPRVVWCLCEKGATVVVRTGAR